MSEERVVTRTSGFLALLIVFAELFGAIWMIRAGVLGDTVWKVLVGVFGLVLFVVLLCGFFVVNPNDSKVLVLFGKYTGTVKANGFYWVNPFTLKHRVSLRAHTLNGDKLKVNDRAGNPIEIAAVVVWKVEDTFAAKFDVDDYEQYVHTQSESAVRKLASAYYYDAGENDDDDVTTLRGDTESINEHLRSELEERFERAGIHVIEARIAHLAYAPEIAQAMLQRQQAAAVVAARRKIVEGAVGMVEMALAELGQREVVDLDDERRAAMVSNLLTVLCSERTTPVLNAGSLYT